MEPSSTETEPGVRTAFRTCPLCEAGCGLELTVEGDRIVRIRGDRDDVFSHGFLCPKGSSLKQLHEDPDRLRRPLVRRDGAFVEVDWDEAWRVVAEGLHGVVDRHGRDATAVYLGNPGAHNLAPLFFTRSVIKGLGTRNVFSASTVDQMPKQVASGFLFGTPVTVAVPDLDRTSYLLMLGANPYASNGSLCTAPDFPGRLAAIRERGGRVVVVDPRRTRTAEMSDEWIAVVPGTDALLLAAIAHVLFADGLVRLGRLGGLVSGLAEVEAALAPFTPEAVTDRCGVEASTIRRLAHELAAAPTAAVYGRIGTCVTEFGTTASWLVDVVNVLTGNLDREGGAMFPLPAVGSPNASGAAGSGPGFRTARGRTRVRELPEACGEYPVAALAEEITTPGPGRVRALVTIAGNPVLSTPNPDGGLEAALDDLEFMVSVDIYLNETTRHADVILPAPSVLQRGHYDVALLGFAVHNVANYSAPVFPLEPGQPDEWEILARLASIAQGAGPDADPAALDDLIASSMARSAVQDPSSPVAGRDPQDLLDALAAEGRTGPERLLDLRLRTGPYGDGFGARPDGVSLAVLEANPHGVDLGALQPRLPEALRTRSGTVELAPPALLGDLVRLASSGPATGPGELLLVNRRDLRSNNSWMHNLDVLVRGKDRCTLHVHPDDAAALGVGDGELVTVSSPDGAVDVHVDVTDAIRPGVVSLPHGWGHHLPETRLSVAGRRPGVNVNRLVGVGSMDPLSGTSALTAVPVRVTTHR